MTVTSKECLARYGAPETEKHMTLLYVPDEWHLHRVPKKIYCGKDLKPLLTEALFNVAQRGLEDLVKTYDGCFAIRKKRGASSMSLHSWGLAVDINAAWNRFGQPSTQDPRLVKCFTDAGFNWGGNWSKIDAMHFEIKELPK